MADTDVEKIKDRLSINEVVGQYVKLTRAGRNYKGLCPFHKERTPSFMVSPERGSYMCFGCGEKGDIFSFVQKMDSIDFPAALRMLAERAGVTLERAAPIKLPQEKEKEERLREVCEEATKFFQSKLAGREDVQSYLHTRGVKDETIEGWRLGYAPASWDELSKYLLAKGFKSDEIVEAGLALKSERKMGELYDRFRGRLMFPLFDPQGLVVAFSGRFFEKVVGSREEGEPAKYVNSPETVIFKKSKMLYGFNKAKQHVRESNCFLLVEGQFDVIMSHQSGFPIAVALSGTALTEEHLSLLGRYTKNLILALDADPAGLRAGFRSLQMAYKAGFSVKVPAFGEGKDPADIAKENPELLKASIRTSKPAIEYFTSILRLSSRDEPAFKKAVKEQVIPLIASIRSPIEQNHVTHVVASIISTDPASLMKEVIALTRAPAAEVVPSLPVLQSVQLLPIERIAGMLMFKFEHDESMQEGMRELLGKDRYDIYVERLAPEAERLRFEFDSIGEEPFEVSDALLKAVERSVVEEEMKKVQSALLIDSTQHPELLKRLSTLKLRQQELRK